MKRPQFVMAGLFDPAIHPLRKTFLEDRWIRGSSPRMTTKYVEVAFAGTTPLVFTPASP